MSDHPSNSNPKNQAPGWHTPQTPGGWRPPEEKPEPVGWRVPTLPTSLDVEPDQEGIWHLPQPEDTNFTAEDVTEVIGLETRPPEAIDPVDALADALSGISEAPADTDTELSPASPEDMMDMVNGDEDEPTGQAAPEDMMALAVEEDDTDEDDFDAFSMSELLALASLVEDEPKPDVMQGASGPTVAMPQASLTEETQPDYADLSPAERAMIQPTEVMPQAADIESGDPGDYARKQLEALEQGQPAEQIKQDQGALDPGEYARRQLAQLGGDTGAGDKAALSAEDYARQQLQKLAQGEDEFTPLPQQTTPMDPEAVALAQKFRETEEQVRALRSMYHAGQITRDDLQSQLRQYMILDNDQVWWMMGVETDTWYKFVQGEWTPATPPAMPAQQRPGAPPTITSQLDPNQVIEGSLPYLPSEPVEEYSQGGTQYDPNQYATGGIALDENNMPLPQRVPIHDPEYTVVGSRSPYLDPVRPSEAPTLESTQPAGSSAPTLVAQPVQYGAYDSVEAPYDAAAEPPDFATQDIDSPIYEDAARQRQQSLLRVIILVAVLGVGLVLIAGAGLVLGAVSWYNGIVSEWEPKIAALQNFEPEFQTARILDARGDLIAELTSESGGARTKVELKDIAPEMIFAVIAVENERFYEDPGWDVFAITRAFFQNLTSGEIASGGSTITQQIARNLVLQNTEATAERKVNEIVIAGELAKRYDKNFILKLYLNEIFFGNQSYGVEAAAQFYFNHSAADLNLAESALLAGLIQSPATYDPVVNRQAAFDRMDFVMNRMTQVGCLRFQHAPYQGEPFCVNRDDVYNANGDFSPELAVQVAFVKGRPFRPREFTVKYPHFVNFVQAQLENFFGAGEMYRRGFTIQTTMLPQIQDVAQNALTTRLAALVNTGVNTGAIMVTDPNTGAIRAMVGSPDFNNVDIDGQVNNVLTLQQPGSAIKPVEYVGALEGVDRNGNGRLEFDEYYTPATVLWDVPTTYPQLNYRPVNFDGTFRGPVAMRYALANSYNVPAVKTFDFIGAEKFKDVAQRMGLHFAPDAQFTLATGVGATDVRLYDMMVAYGTLATGGRFIPLYAIESVTDSEGRKVEIPQRPQPQQVIQPEIAYLMQNILSDDNARSAAFGRNSALTLPGYPTQDYVAAKTGTTNQNRDLWTMGFTRTAVVGVWLGRHDNQPTVAPGGFTAAAPIWNQVMQAAVAGVQPQPFTTTPNVILDRICALTGTYPSDACPNIRNEYFLASQPPPPADQSFVQTIQVDTWTGLRANEFCPDNVTTQTFASIQDQSAINWLNTTPQGQTYAQQLGLPLPLENAPAGACEFGTTIPTARIIDPFDNKTIEGTVSITGQVSANQGEFSRYQLEYADVNNPNTFQIIGQFSTQQQPNAGSVLGTWDTRGVPNGTYILRLAVFSNSGGYLYRTARVNVNNPQPTPIPTTIPATEPPAVFTPIPFDTLPPQGTPFDSQSVPGGATPTLEVPSL